MYSTGCTCMSTPVLHVGQVTMLVCNKKSVVMISYNALHTVCLYHCGSKRATMQVDSYLVYICYLYF